MGPTIRLGWRATATRAWRGARWRQGGFEAHGVTGTHWTIVAEPAVVRQVARVITACMRRAQAGQG